MTLPLGQQRIITVKKPTTLAEAVRYFSDPDDPDCFWRAVDVRWPNGPMCPRCRCPHFSYLSTRRLWKCKDCKYQYSVKVGTIFEDSPLGFDKWLLAVWVVASDRGCAISSRRFAREIGVTQKSAWFMLDRIRKAMRAGGLTNVFGRHPVIYP